MPELTKVEHRQISEILSRRAKKLSACAEWRNGLTLQSREMTTHNAKVSGGGAFPPSA